MEAARRPRHLSRRQGIPPTATLVAAATLCHSLAAAKFQILRAHKRRNACSISVIISSPSPLGTLHRSTHSSDCNDTKKAASDRAAASYSYRVRPRESRVLRQRHVRPTGLSSQVSSRRGWVTGPPLALLSERPLPLLRVLRLPFETVAGSLIVAIASSSVIPLEEGSAALFSSSSSQVKGPTLVLRRAAAQKVEGASGMACVRACVRAAKV